MVIFKIVKPFVNWLRRIRRGQVSLLSYLSKTPENPTSILKPRDFYQQAKSCLECRDLEGAIASLQEAIAHFPDYVPGYVRLAQLLERCERLSEAESIATVALHKDINDRQRWQLLEARGLVRVQRGDIAAGGEDLRAAKRLNSHKSIIDNAAKRLGSLRKNDLAIQLLQDNEPFLQEFSHNHLGVGRHIRNIEESYQTFVNDLQRVQSSPNLRLRNLQKQPIFELATYPGSQFPPSQYSNTPVCYEFPVANRHPISIEPEDDCSGLLKEDICWMFEKHVPTLYQQCDRFMVTLPNAVVATIGEDHKVIVSEEGFYYQREQPGGVYGRGYAVFYPQKKTIELGFFPVLRSTTNYYHMIADILSSFVQYPLESLDCPIFVFSEHLELVRMLVEGLEIDPQRVQLIEPEMGIVVKTALVGKGEKYLDGCLGNVSRQISKNILEQSNVKLGPAKRIYISRRRGLRRPLKNERMVELMLQQLGFEVVFMEDESFKNQILMMTNVSVVIAPHGAGLTNILFAPVGTTVIELLPKAYPPHLFWELSCLCGHRYYPLIGEMCDTADLSNEETVVWEVSCDRLRELLRHILGL